MIKKTLWKFMQILAGIAPVLHTKILYYIVFKKKLNLKKPVTLNEKLLWLKLYEYSHNKLCTLCADKYLVRKYIKDKGCEEILNELYGVYDKAEDIDFNQLPNKFVLKCNHSSGQNIICDDKNVLDIKNTKETLKKWLIIDFWRFFSEIHYKNIDRKIIAEKFIENDIGEFPDDYKFYCFHGKPEVIMLCTNRKTKTKFYYFDLEWNILPLSTDSIIAIENNECFTKPKGLDKLVEYAKKLCTDFEFVRVDLYLVDSSVLFGELTFCPGAGLDRDRLYETDVFLGNKLNLDI